jgi:hypothetical protein
MNTSKMTNVQIHAIQINKKIQSKTEDEAMKNRSRRIRHSGERF